MSRQSVTAWAQPNDPTRYPRPASVCFVKGDEMLAIAMQAYLQACRAVVPPAGQPWIEDGMYVWSGPEDFANHLLDAIRSRLDKLALQRGHMELVTDAAPGCRGGAPAVKGHGCPAPAGSPSGGPVSGWTRAQEPSVLDITSHADPLLAAQAMQELPGGKCRDNLNPEGEKVQ